MATYTTHYNLKKPATSDKIRIADFNGNADIIDGQMYDNETLGAQLKSDIGIVENTNTATHNISAGQYVIWKGELYVASDAISSGATLSNANLTAVTGGGLNALNSKLTRKSKQISSISVSANDIETGDADVSSDPGDNLFVVGFDVSASTQVVPMQIYMSNKNTIHYRLKNVSNSAQTCTLYVYYC
jgi:hypothetical protein